MSGKRSTHPTHEESPAALKRGRTSEPPVSPPASEYKWQEAHSDDIYVYQVVERAVHDLELPDDKEYEAVKDGKTLVSFMHMKTYFKAPEAWVVYIRERLDLPSLDTVHCGSCPNVEELFLSMPLPESSKLEHRVRNVHTQLMSVKKKVERAPAPAGDDHWLRRIKLAIDAGSQPLEQFLSPSVNTALDVSRAVAAVHAAPSLINTALAEAHPVLGVRYNTKTWHNWGETLVCSPVPVSDRDHLIDCRQLDQIQAPRKVDGKWLLQVNPGCSAYSVQQSLEKLYPDTPRLVFGPSDTVSDRFTYGGIISPGCHGSGRIPDATSSEKGHAWGIGVISDQVASLTLLTVDQDGEVQEVVLKKDEDEEQFNLATTGLGMYGFLAWIELEMWEECAMEQVDTFDNASEWLSALNPNDLTQLAEKWRSEYQKWYTLEVFYIPFTKQLWFKGTRFAPAGSEIPKRKSYKKLFASAAFTNKAFELMVHFPNGAFNELVKLYNQMVLGQMKKLNNPNGTTVNKMCMYNSIHYLNGALVESSVRLDDVEYVLPLRKDDTHPMGSLEDWKRVVMFWQTCQHRSDAGYAKKVMPITTIMEMRVTSTSPSTLAPAQKQPAPAWGDVEVVGYAWVEYLSYSFRDGESSPPFILAAKEMWSKLNPTEGPYSWPTPTRAHLAKNFSAINDEVSVRQMRESHLNPQNTTVKKVASIRLPGGSVAAWFSKVFPDVELWKRTARKKYDPQSLFVSDAMASWFPHSE